MATSVLTDRGVVRVTGPEARMFLDRLVTCDLDRVSPGRPRYGALLSPQGKILVDFVAFEVPGGEGAEFYLDAPAGAVADLVKRLTLYKLRAKLSVTDLTGTAGIAVGWGEPEPAGAITAAPDPRLPALGWRAILPAAALPGGAERSEYDAHRVALGVPESGRDFALGDAFPHEALMDALAGVDFDKGCYVGQEVVSRMQHRGTARTRVVRLAFDGTAPAPGTEVTGGERVLGRVGSASGRDALATIRLDRAADALAAGDPVAAAGQPARFAKPEWVRFAYPAELTASAA